MGVGARYRKWLFGIGRFARIGAGRFPQSLPDVRADVRQRLFGEETGGGGRSRVARRGETAVGFAQRGPVLVAGGGRQPLDLLYHRRDAGFLGLELTDGPGGITGEIGNEGLKPSLSARSGLPISQ